MPQETRPFVYKSQNIYNKIKEYYFKTHNSPAKWTVMKILFSELLRFSSNTKSQSVKKITPLGKSYNPSLTPCHVSSVYFQSKCIFFSHCSQGWGSAQLMKIKLSFFPCHQQWSDNKMQVLILACLLLVMMYKLMADSFIFSKLGRPCWENWEGKKLLILTSSKTVGYTWHDMDVRVHNATARTHVGLENLQTRTEYM